MDLRTGGDGDGIRRSSEGIGRTSSGAARSQLAGERRPIVHAGDQRDHERVRREGRACPPGGRISRAASGHRSPVGTYMSSYAGRLVVGHAEGTRWRGPSMRARDGGREMARSKADGPESRNNHHGLEGRTTRDPGPPEDFGSTPSGRGLDSAVSDCATEHSDAAPRRRRDRVSSQHTARRNRPVPRLRMGRQLVCNGGLDVHEIARLRERAGRRLSHRKKGTVFALDPAKGAYSDGERGRGETRIRDGHMAGSRAGGGWHIWSAPGASPHKCIVQVAERATSHPVPRTGDPREGRAGCLNAGAELGGSTRFRDRAVCIARRAGQPPAGFWVIPMLPEAAASGRGYDGSRTRSRGSPSDRRRDDRGIVPSAARGQALHRPARELGRLVLHPILEPEGRRWLSALEN